MENAEARKLLITELARYRRKTHADLQRLLQTQDTFEIEGPSGTRYQVEIEAVWDDHSGGHLRVLGHIDDGGWRAFVPLSEDFIMSPDGNVIGE
jgi:hypothetical protein